MGTALPSSGENQSARTPQELCTSSPGGEVLGPSREPPPPLLTWVRLGGRSSRLGLRKAGQHGRQVQDEPLHLGVPNTAKVTSQSESPVPTPKAWDAAKQGWGWRTLLKHSSAVVPRPKWFRVFTASVSLPNGSLADAVTVASCQSPVL